MLLSDLSCVSEEPLAELEEADLFSDPEDDLLQHICEVRRSLSLDSEGTEPEMHRGNVLNKIAFFETFQRSFEIQSRSNSESSFRRSLIQDELEELASRPKKQATHEEDEQTQVKQEKEEEKEGEEEEHECQLEFDDIFLAHREEDEAEAHVDKDMYEEGCEEDDESLVSVSDTEEVLEFTDYDTRPEDVQNYEFEDNYCVTHEFIEEEPSALEIFDFSDEEASHQYADLTDPVDQPRSSTKRVLASLSLGTATEFHENEPFKLCKDEPPDVMGDAPDNYSEELFQTRKAIVEMPETSFKRTLDPDHCFVATKQDDVDTRMKELISKVGLLLVEDNKEDHKEVFDFNETIEEKLLENVVSGRENHEIQDKRIPIEETCEAFIKDNVESEIDFDELFARLERDGTESEEGDATPQTSTKIERSESPDTIHVVLRDHDSERSADMERISGDIELQSSEQLSEGELEQERELIPDITLNYECPKSMPEDDIEPVAETIEAVEQERKPKNLDLEELDTRMDGPSQTKTSREAIIEDGNEVASEEECCEVVFRDHDQERSRVFEEIGLVPVSSDITHSVDEPVEALSYDQTPKSTVSELPEVKELISAEVRRDVRFEINFEERFRAIDEVVDGQSSKETADQDFDAVQDTIETSKGEECCEAVLRDYDQERDRDLKKRDLELVSASPDITDSFSEPVEPLPYDQAPKSSPQSQLLEVSEVVDAEVRQVVQSEINFDEMFLHLEEHVDETAETQRFEETVTAVIEETSRASLYLEEDTMVDDVVHCASSTSAHISHETKNDMPAEESAEVKQAVERNRPPSPYQEEITVIEEVTAEIASSPKHVAGEDVNLERIEVVNEVKEGEGEERASLTVDEGEVVTEVNAESPSSQHVAGEAENIEPFEEVDVETVGDHDNRASLYMEEEHVLQNVSPEVFSSPRHIANECENINLPQEAEEIEEREEVKRASLYMDENVLVDSVTTEEASSYPLHIAGETQNVDLQTHREEVEPSEDKKRASMYSEDVISVAEVNCDTPPSPKHIACESVNTEHVEKVESENPIEQENRASLYLEDEVLVDEIISDTPSSPKHIASESENTEFIEEVGEQVEDEKRSSLFIEEKTTVSYVTTRTPSPLHVACESANSESVEEMHEEEFGEVEKRASLFLEEDSVVNEIVPDIPSSPKHIAGESHHVEAFGEIDEELNEERKRASLFLEEAAVLDEVTTDAPSSPKHVTAESRNVELFEEIHEEPTEESKRALLFLEEAPNVEEVTTDVPSSPKHISDIIRNVETFEEIEEEPTEESKRASLFLEEAVIVDDVKTDIPSSPKHLAGESVNSETFEEVAVVPEDENKRASVFLEEDISYGYVSVEDSDQNHHVAGEISNSGFLEVTDDEEFPESDYGEHFEEFKGIYATETLVGPPKVRHIAGEMQNIDSHDKAVEDVLQLEETLEYEDRPKMVTTTDLLETTQTSFHIAGELSNVEPREESSEEEKPEEEASAEEIEETEVQASTVVLKSPQSLLSIAAAALEQNIDAAQQDVSEECTTETDIAEQYSEKESADVKLVVSEALTSNACAVHEREGVKQHEETVEITVILEHSPIIYEETETTDVTVTDDTKVPAILVNIAGELSGNEEDNIVFVEDEHQEVHEIETERYEDQEETAIEYPAEEQQVQAHATAEFCVSEFVLNEGETEEQTDFVGAFEESEEGSVSELLSECSSSPLHASSELKDFQDYETISEEYGTETYHAILYEEGDYVSEKSISKGLPSLFITEELTPHEIYQENKFNEQSMVLETTQEYNEAEEPFQKQTSVVISQSPLQTTAELSASDYNDGVEEEDELSEREFMEEFVDTEILHESTRVVSKVVNTSDPKLAEDEDDLLDETDNAQKFEVQETLVSLEQPTKDTSFAVLTSEDEPVVHKEEKILEEVWEVEIKKGSQYVETFEENHEASQVQKFTVVSEKEQRSVEMKSSYQVLESKESYSVSQTHRGESVLVGEQGTQIELSHEVEKKVEVFSTRTVHHHVSSTTSTSANEFTSVGTQFQLETNGACISREEVRNIQEASFTAIQQTSQQRSWKKEEDGRLVERSDQLSESILDKEAKDNDLEKFEKQLSEEETEVRLMKSEVMEYKTAEQQAPLVSPRVTVEKETTFVKALVVHSGTKEQQEQVLMREDRVTAILKDDEASLEEESAREQFEEEIDIMRIDEALSEEEFRGEGDRVQSRSSKVDSKEELEKSEEMDEEEVKIREVESFYEEEFEVQRIQGQVEEASHESDDNLVDTSAFEEEIEVTAFEGSDDPVKESLEPAEEIEVRTQQPVFEEELEVSAFPKEDSPVFEDYAEEDRQVNRSAVFEEELEVSAVAIENEQVEKQNKSVDHSAIFEKKLEVASFEKQNIEEEIPAEHSAVLEEELEASALTTHEPVEQQHAKVEEREAVLVEDEKQNITDDEKSVEQTDEEHIETTRTSTQRQPLDLSQVDLYDDEEGASATRYYVELSSTESLEPAYEEVEDETCYTETYVRQGDPLEENLEEFILVRYGDEFESSGEEDISDHREIYVIPEEENGVENHVGKATTDDNVKVEELKSENVFEVGFENLGLEEIRESPEFDMDSDSDELDEEEQRQLEEYERLESFVILEEKLSQVESDDEEIADLQEEEGDKNVFHSDVHSSSEETLHEDELAETMIACSVQKAAASSETCKEGEVSQEDDCIQPQEQSSGEQNESPVECSSSREELPKKDEGFAESKVVEEVTLGEGTDNKGTSKEDIGDESLSEDPADKKEDSEFSKTKGEKMEQHLSGDSSGEQSMSSEGSLSSTHSVDLEG